MNGDKCPVCIEMDNKIRTMFPIEEEEDTYLTKDLTKEEEKENGEENPVV